MASSPPRLGELGRLLTGPHLWREADIGRGDDGGPAQLTDLGGGERSQGPANVLDVYMGAAGVVADDHSASEDVEIGEMGARHGPDGGALQRVGQAFALRWVEPAEHRHPVVKADAKDLSAASDYQFVNAHGPPSKIVLPCSIGTANRSL